MVADARRKMLVVYYSLSGNTAGVARDIAGLAHADIEVLRDFDREPPLGFLGYIKAGNGCAGEASHARLGSVVCDPRNYALVVDRHAGVGGSHDSGHSDVPRAL